MVVLTEELAGEIERWVEDHEREHPPRGQVDRAAYGSGGPLQYSAERYLSLESGVTPRKLTCIRNLEERTTQLSVADSLLCTIGRGHLLSGGEIVIYANPAWSRERVIRSLQRAGCDVEQQFWRWDEVHDVMPHACPECDGPVDLIAMLCESCRAEIDGGAKPAIVGQGGAAAA